MGKTAALALAMALAAGPLSGCNSLFSAWDVREYDKPPVGTSIPSMGGMDAAFDEDDEMKYESGLPAAFALDPGCVEQISFECIDYDESRGAFVYLYQYTYADSAYLRAKQAYDALSEAARADLEPPKSAWLLTVLASHRYATGQTTEFFRALTTPAPIDVTAFAGKPPDLDRYTLYFDKKMRVFTKDGQTELTVDFASAYEQLAGATSGYPVRDVVGAEALNEGRRLVVPLVMSQHFNPDAKVQPDERAGNMSCEVVRLSERPAGYGLVMRYDLAGGATAFSVKPRYRQGDVVFSVAENAAALSVRAAPSGLGVEASLPALETKYAAGGAPHEIVSSGGNALYGSVAALRKVYKVVRMPRQDYMNSPYYEPSVYLRGFDEYFPYVEPPPEEEPEPEPEPSADEEAALGEPPVAEEAALGEPPVAGLPLGEPPVAEAAEAAPTGGEGGDAEPPADDDGDDDTPEGPIYYRYERYEPVPASELYIPDFADTPLYWQWGYLPRRGFEQINFVWSKFSNAFFADVVILYTDRDYIYSCFGQGERIDVLIPNAYKISATDTGDWRSLDKNYMGWLRTVWMGTRPYEDVRVLAGYEIEISADSYALCFQTASNQNAQEKPLAGGYTLTQAGDVFTLRDLSNNVAAAGVTVAAANGFGELQSPGRASSGTPGYVILSVPDSAQDYESLDSPEDAVNSFNIRGFGAGALLNVPFQTFHLYDNLNSNGDIYSPKSVLALGAGDYLFSSPQNGALRYSQGGSGGYSASRVLAGAVYRSWRLANGSFVAVGFEPPPQGKKYHYYLSDLP
ncbi:MAG: hypothetical protein LBL83_00695, partial [Clostridiales bacterium]|nr:hypothetical protein [Clostridiales bacterium]